MTSMCGDLVELKTTTAPSTTTSSFKTMASMCEGELVEQKKLTKPVKSNKRLTPSPLDDLSHLPTLSQRKQETFSYDINDYPFHSLVYAMFRSVKEIPDVTTSNDITSTLTSLHQHLLNFTGRTNNSPFHKAFKNVISPHMSVSPSLQKVRQNFQFIYHQFIREIVAPMLDCNPDDLYYQRTPALRIVVPSDTPVGHKHCDYEYGHQPAEVNFWIPLTEVSRTNTLYVESMPGSRDFSPLNGSLGMIFKFWGNQCLHHTVANQEMTTRVSLDFRVVDKRRFNSNFVDRKGLCPGFQVPYYYASSSDNVERPNEQVIEENNDLV